MTPRIHARTAPRSTQEFFQKTLDSLLAHIAILKEDGTIVSVNAAWNEFARRNSLLQKNFGLGSNYLRTCDSSMGDCSEEAGIVAGGIREVIAGRRSDFELEYPCHSPNEQRWYNVRVTRFQIGGEARVVMTHDNITQRKLAEIQVHEANRLLHQQASTDGLTGIANRRTFDQTLADAWKDHERRHTTLSVAMLDVDCFKQYNDQQGHAAGDDCLRQVAQTVWACMRRPGDFAARYGGEEFAVILPNTPLAGAVHLLSEVLERVRGLSIPHPNSKVDLGIVTFSMGVATMIPTRDETATLLLGRADKALYEAKSNGRNRLIACESVEA